MDLLVQGILGVITCLCAGMLLVLAIEALAAVFARQHVPSSNPERDGALAVVVPAHNEEACLAQTLADIVKGLGPRDRCVVVADNCVDATAQVARRFPVEVLERHSETKRGKGYALDAGITHLRSSPPDVVLVIDADCQVQPESLHALAHVAARTGRPVQGCDMLHAPPGSGVGTRISAFAFHFKNHVRSVGTTQLGGPCLLFGTGMAFPWDVAAQAEWATSSSVEDMQLAVKLAVMGKGVRYVPIPCVSAYLPTEKKESRQQRRRWEHGHVRTLLAHAPRLFARGLFTGRPSLMLLGAHLAVPPLSLLALIVLMVAALDGVDGWLTGNWVWLKILGAAVLLSVVSVLLAWGKYGRAILPGKDLALIPFYIAGKLPIYFGLLWRPQKTWNEPVTAVTGTPAKDLEP